MEANFCNMDSHGTDWLASALELQTFTNLQGPGSWETLFALLLDGRGGEGGEGEGGQQRCDP